MLRERLFYPQTDSFASTPLSVQVTFAWDYWLEGFLTLLQRLNDFASRERKSRKVDRVLLLVPTKVSFFSGLTFSGFTPIFCEYSWKRTRERACIHPCVSGALKDSKLS